MRPITWPANNAALFRTCPGFSRHSLRASDGVADGARLAPQIASGHS